MAYFLVGLLCQHFPGRTEEIHKYCQSGNDTCCEFRRNYPNHETSLLHIPIKQEI